MFSIIVSPQHDNLKIRKWKVEMAIAIKLAYLDNESHWLKRLYEIDFTVFFRRVNIYSGIFVDFLKNKTNF